MKRTEGRHQKQTLYLDHQHKESLAGKERLRTAPPCIDSQRSIASQIRTGLNEEWLARKFDGCDISGRAWCECHLTWTTSSGKSRDEGRLAAGSALDCAQKAALHLRLQFDVS